MTDRRLMLARPMPFDGYDSIGALETYTEFPVDLVTDVHWKKKGPPPPPLPEECGTQTFGFVIRPSGPALSQESFGYDLRRLDIRSGLEVVSIEFAFSFSASAAATPFADMVPPPHPWYRCHGLQVSSSVGGNAFLGEWAEGDPPLTGGFTDVIGPSESYPTLSATYASEEYTGNGFYRVAYPSGGIPIEVILIQTYFCIETP